MAKVKMNETTLAAMTGIEPIKKPYAVHSIMPVHKSRYITIETSLVDFVFHVFIACGKKDPVVNTAATKPSAVTESI